LSEEWWDNWDEYNPCEDDEALDHPEECGVELELEPEEGLEEELEEEEW